MKKFWEKISFNGIDTRGDYSSSKELIILNQLNFFIFVIFSLVLIVFLPGIIKEGIHIDSFRVILIIALTILNIFLNSRKRFIISKISLVVFLPFLLLIFPTMLGDVIDEYFFWYPYAVITFSLIPHFIFNYKNEKKYLFITLFFYFLLVITIEHILFIVKSKDLQIFQIVKDNFKWIKHIHLFLFSFINIAFYYTLNLLKRFELSLKEANNDLEEHKEELEEKNCELESLITKLKETQTQLFHADKMTSIGVLASGIAHEINNPLNYISGSIQAINQLVNDCLGKEKNHEEINETILNIKSLIPDTTSGIDRVTEIVNSLMTFSFRGESKLIPTDINKLLDSTILLTRSKIPPQIEVVKKYSQLPAILTHQDSIHQLIFNILDNAVIAIQSKGEIISEKIILTTYSNSSGNGFITLIIANTGPQIPDDIITKIFDPFFTTKEPEQGTGLGLSICYNIVRDHEGSIYARNNSDLVEFIIELPIQ